METCLQAIHSRLAAGGGICPQLADRLSKNAPETGRIGRVQERHLWQEENVTRNSDRSWNVSRAIVIPESQPIPAGGT